MTNYRHGQMIDIIGAMNHSLLSVKPNRCMLVRNRNADCLRCAAVCTTGAISLSDEGIEVNPLLCIGCGTCASACPTGCLNAANPTDEQLFAAAEEALFAGKGTVAFACEQALHALESGAWEGDAQSVCQNAALEQGAGASMSLAPGSVAGMLGTDIPVIRIVCLGRIDESLLVELTARKATLIKLVSCDCSCCEHQHGGSLCNDVCRSADNLLAAFGIFSPIERIELNRVEGLRFIPLHEGSSPCETPHGDNDANISSLSDATHAFEDIISQDYMPHNDALQSKNPSKNLRINPSIRTALVPGASKKFTSVFPHVQADGTLPHYVPERRLRLFNSLKALTPHHSDSVTTRLWGQVTIDTDLCRSCRMCTVFCPTGAVTRFSAEDGSFGVEHRSALCVQCHMCEVICPEGAITVTNVVSLGEFLSGRKFRFTMRPIGWNPAQEDAIASRMARFIKADAVQDPQAKVLSTDTAERRDYARQRDLRRKEIRDEK